MYHFKRFPYSVDLLKNPETLLKELLLLFKQFFIPAHDRVKRMLPKRIAAIKAALLVVSKGLRANPRVDLAFADYLVLIIDLRIRLQKCRLYFVILVEQAGMQEIQAANESAKVHVVVEERLVDVEQVVDVYFVGSSHFVLAEYRVV